MWNNLVIFGLGTTLRLILVCYGRIQDALLDVKFTDVDYSVFVDAAANVVAGNSPYDRPTYRYTPLIAWILTPTVEFAEFGKILFNLCDLMNAFLIQKLSILNGFSSDTAVIVALFNPLTVIVSSRGNAESIISLNVLLILYFLRTQRFVFASVLHGLAIHMKIYPIIYLPSIFFHLIRPLSKSDENSKKNIVLKILCNFRGIFYCLSTLATFVLLEIFFFSVYGWTFLDESLLYHFRRTDIKHNFSPYFYLLYLYKNSSALRWVSLAAFLPQMILVLVFSWKYRHDLNFAWFLSTLAFVSFNKVCTSQYFVWYLTFFPMILAQFHFTFDRILKMSIFWFGAQGIWLFFAYLLEFRGWNTFFLVWLSSLLFLIVNCYLIVTFVRCYPLESSHKKLKKNN